MPVGKAAEQDMAAGRPVAFLQHIAARRQAPFLKGQRQQGCILADEMGLGPWRAGG